MAVSTKLRNGIIIGAVGLISAGIIFKSATSNAFWDGLIEKFESGKSEVYVNEITDFDWDTVCAIPPYALDVKGSGDRIKEYIKGDLGGFEGKIPHLNNDNAWAFVFIKDGTVINVIKKGRKYYLEKNYKSNCISKESAKFSSAESTLGTGYITISD